MVFPVNFCEQARLRYTVAQGSVLSSKIKQIRF